MTFQHGWQTAVLADGHDLSEFFNQQDSAKMVDADPVTTFGHQDKVYLSGLEDGSLSLGGFFDGDAAAVDEVLSSIFGGSNEPILSVGLAGVSTLGSVAVLLQGIQTEYSTSSPMGPVTISASAQAKSGVRVGGRVGYPLATIAAVDDGDHIDDAAATTLGGVAHLHLLALTGTDIDVRLQHTADDPLGTPTWVDLVAFEATSAAGGYRSTFAGTVNRYVRAVVDGGTFTSATLAVTYARNRR